MIFFSPTLKFFILILLNLNKTCANPTFNLYHEQVEIHVRYRNHNEYKQVGSGTLITKSWVLCSANLLDPINSGGLVEDVEEAWIQYKDQEVGVESWKIHDWLNDEGVNRETPDFVLMQLRGEVEGVVMAASRGNTGGRTAVRYGRVGDDVLI